MSNQETLFSRRELMGAMAAGAVMMAGGGLIPVLARAEDVAPPAAAAGKSTRIVHMTDMHVQEELKGIDGYVAALRSVAKLDPKPEVILTGGDHVFDVMNQERPRTEKLWDLYTKAIAEAQVPVKAALGNHDVYGWGQPEKVKPDEAGYGKVMTVDKLKMPGRYHTFDVGGWKFFALDTVIQRGKGYYGGIDNEQREWLKAELAKTPTTQNVGVLTHIPILTVTTLMTNKPLKDGVTKHEISDGLMLRDSREVIAMFAKHKLRLALSGHIHMLDRIDFRGTSFICDGAVSGSWWKGPHQDVPEGYGVLDLHADGRVDHQYVAYGWKAVKE